MLLSWAWRHRLGLTVSGFGAPCSMKSYLLTSQAGPQAPSITPVGCWAINPRDARSKSSGSIPRSRGVFAVFVWTEASFGNVAIASVSRPTNTSTELAGSAAVQRTPADVAPNSFTVGSLECQNIST